MSRTDGEGSQPVRLTLDDLRAVWDTDIHYWRVYNFASLYGNILIIGLGHETHMTESTISWQPPTHGAYQPGSFYSAYGRLKGERLVRARAVLTRFYWGLQNGTAHNAMPTPGKARDMAAIKARVEKIDWEWDKEAFNRKVSGEPEGPGFSRNLKPMQQAALVEQLEAALAWQPDKATTKKWAADDRRQLDIEGAMGPMEYVNYDGDYI